MKVAENAALSCCVLGNVADTGRSVQKAAKSEQQQHPGLPKKEDIKKKTVLVSEGARWEKGLSWEHVTDSPV